MFRRSGRESSNSLLKRLRRADQDDWVMLPNPADHIHVTVDDLSITDEDVQKFEAEFDLLRRPSSHIGSTARYDWEGMNIAMMVRIHYQGLPVTQTEWVGEVQDWFVANSGKGDVPDEWTIRRRLTLIWKALRGSD